MIQSTQKKGSEKTRFSSGLLVQQQPGQTIIHRAAKEVPEFATQLKKFHQQMTLSSFSKSTLYSYARAVSGLALHFEKTPLDLDDEQINNYLYKLTLNDSMSKTYFKHLVYGLRFFFRMYDRETRALKLPSIKFDQKLPVVLSRQELKRLFMAPKRLKQRVIFCLIYAAGLRISELCNLRISDLDFDRKQIRIRQSKGNKDRYVIMSEYIIKGLKRHMAEAKPSVYVFNGRVNGEPISKGTIGNSFRLALKKANILKEACVHTLRHSFATHMLEDGVDIVTIKEQLGHAHVRTTMMYLHVATIPRSQVRSPLDTLYYEELEASS